MITFRHATVDDKEALSELLGELGYPVNAESLPDRLERFRSRGNGQVIVAETNDRIVAFAALEITFPLHHAHPVAHLSSFAVSHASRRQGIGKLLLTAVEQTARAAGCERMVVTSAEQRDDAHAFYPAAGWTLTGRRFGKVVS